MGRGPFPPSQLTTLRQMIIVTGIIVLLLFVAGYTGKLLTSGRVHSDKAALEHTVQMEDQRQTELLQELVNVDSPAEIERVARDELNMAKPGDHPIVVVQDPAGDEIEPLLTPTPTPTPTHWQRWLALLLH
ncbi:MAG: septum formation initiator family protein [Chloroflexi bacterium]|nr:septum formation initiator family protein [Chloroflexota bacterium]